MFWLRNKKINFQLGSLIWRPVIGLSKINPYLKGNAFMNTLAKSGDPDEMLISALLLFPRIKKQS